MGRVVTGKSADEILDLVGDFFMKKDDVHQTMRRVASRLEDEKIDYAIIGGMALTLHGFVRPTGDVDILTTREGLDKIRERLVGRGYVPAFTGARKRLRDTVNGIFVEFITTGEYPGDGKPKPVRFPDPAGASVKTDQYSVISLPKLVELKLASGMTAPQRIRDLADVQDLIKALNLPRSFGEELDPYVREEFYRRWDIAQQPDPLAG
jgi:hypothetical protein